MQKGFLTLSEQSESKGSAPILIILGIILVTAIVGGAYYFGKSQTLKPQNPVISQTPQPTMFPSSSPDASPVPNDSTENAKFLDKKQENTEDQFCGGFAGKLCPTGYTCKLDGNYPDAGGKCVKQ